MLPARHDDDDDDKRRNQEWMYDLEVREGQRCVTRLCGEYDDSHDWLLGVM